MNERILKARLRRGMLLTLLLCVVIMTVGIILTAMLNRSLNTLLSGQMEQETEEYKNRILQQIDKDFQTLQTLSAFVGDNSFTDSEEFAASLWDANRQNEFLIMAYFNRNEDGVLVRPEEDAIENVELGELGEEAKTAAEAAYDGEKAVSWLFWDAVSGERIFIYSVPVYRNGEITGVLMAGDRIEVFAGFLDEEAVLSGSGYMHLIGSEGKFLVRSQQTIVPDTLNTIYDDDYISSSEQEKIRMALENGESIFSCMQYNGKSYRIYFEPIGLNGWYLLCVDAGKGILASVYQRGQIIAVTLAGILALCLFLLIYSYRLMRGYNRQIHDIAYHDAVTRSDNYLRFCQKLDERERQRERYSIVALNIRQFKFINEIFGQQYANRLLCRVKEVIEHTLTRGEIFCRSNADLFYLALADTERGTVRRRVEAIMDEVSRSAPGVQNNYRVLMYAGAVIPESGQESSIDREKLVISVHFALARAKLLTANRVWFYDAELHKKEEVENYVESHMYGALRSGEFQMYLQPKMNLHTGELGGAEALVRWKTGDGRMIYPDQFIPLFEKNGFCAELDMYMVEKVCGQLREWMDAGITPVPISVNQSKRLFFRSSYLKDLTNLLEKYGVSAKWITLEILEGLAMENADELNEKIKKLQAVGFKVSMDDFGSGYSSLNTLGSLNIDELKLDREFLLEISGEKGERFRTIMEQIINMTKCLRISTVVEGVETPENERLIKALDCDYGQGYYYSRPIPAGEFSKSFMRGRAEG